MDIDSLASCLYRWALVIPSCGDVNRRDWKRKAKAKVVIPRSLSKLWRRYHVRTCTYLTKSGRFLSLSRVSVAAFSALRDVKKSPLRNGLFSIHLKIYLLKMLSLASFALPSAVKVAWILFVICSFSALFVYLPGWIAGTNGRRLVIKFCNGKRYVSWISSNPKSYKFDLFLLVNSLH